MPKKLMIISTCTNEKRSIPAPECRLDTCIQGTCVLTVKKWLSQIERADLPRRSARTMYAGSHWKETLACVSAASTEGYDAHLWVLSAGWGFIHSEQEVTPYSATFAAGRNSVQNLPWRPELSPKERSREWWKLLHTYRCGEEFLSLGDLPDRSEAEDDLHLVLIVSGEYFGAIEPEVLELVGRGIGVTIVSAGLYRKLSGVSPLLREHVLPVSEKFKQADGYLNKTNVSLNARLATWIIREHGAALRQGHDALYARLAEIDSRLPDMKRPKPVKMTDEEVLAYIARTYDPATSSATSLLRRLRWEEGMSCEQKRFGELFRRHVESTLRKGLFDA